MPAAQRRNVRGHPTEHDEALFAASQWVNDALDPLVLGGGDASHRRRRGHGGFDGDGPYYRTLRPSAFVPMVIGTTRMLSSA